MPTMGSRVSPLLLSFLMISDMPGLLKAIYTIDDLGLDQISTGNVIGWDSQTTKPGEAKLKELG